MRYYLTAAAVAAAIVGMLALGPVVNAHAGSKAKVLNDSTLVIDGRRIAYIKIEGTRCVMATETTGSNSTALSCDFLNARP